MPTSRADFASIFLSGLIPGFESYDSDHDSMLGAAQTWYEESKKLNLTQIAREFLRNGSDQQTQLATKFLVDRGDEEDFSIMEEGFIESALESPWSMSEEIPDYVKKRGDSGKAFIKKLEKAIQEHLLVLKEDTERKDEYENQKKAYDQGLKQLLSLTSSETAADILTRVIAGEDDINEVQQVFYKKLMDEPLPGRITILLDGIIKADDPDLSAAILQYFSYVNREKKAPVPPVSQHADSWKKIMADTRKTGEDIELRLSAAYLIEQFYGTAESEELQNFWSSTGTIGGPFLIKHASARVEGKTGDELPKYPKADDVPADRRTALTTELLALVEKPEELRARLGSLTLAEKIWVVGKRFDPDDESHKAPPLEEAISIAQNAIKEVEVPQGWSGFDSWSGELFSPEKFDQLIKQALERLAGGETFEIEIKAAGPFGPLNISITPASMEELTAEESPAAQTIQQWLPVIEKKTPLIAASSDGKYYSTFWFGDKKESDTESEDQPTDRFSQMLPRMKEGQKAFRNNLRQWAQPALAMTNPMEFTFFGAIISPVSESEDEKEK